MPGEADLEPDIVELNNAALDKLRPDGPPSIFTCPECHGILWELQEGELARFRCYMGHVFSPDSLAAKEAEVVEGALWSALRVLIENESLRLHLAQRAYKRGNPRMAARYEEEARDSRQRADLLRQVLLGNRLASTALPADEPDYVEQLAN